MININLLIKPPPAVRWRFLARTVAITAALGIALVTTIDGWSEMHRLRMGIAEGQELVEAYQAVSRRLPELQTRLAAAEQAEAELARIGRNQRFSQAEVLAVVHVTPADLWLTDLAFDGRNLLVSGRSHSFASAIAYLNDLRGEARVAEVVEMELTTDAEGESAFTYLIRVQEEVVSQ